jgi:hypothetical protein
MSSDTRRMLRAARLAALSLTLFAAACGGGDAPGAESGATPEEVDTEASATVTEEEQQAFTPPADSVITPQQAEQYLKTALLQFDLVSREAEGFHDQAKRIDDRGKKGGLLNGLRNAADAVGFMARFADVVGGSYVRSARTLKYNPAEMEWVRDRMGEVGVYLAIGKQAEAASASMATQMREQARALREQLNAGQLQGYTEEDVRNMEAQAAEMEQAAGQSNATGAVQRNVAVLQRARPNVTDKMWAGVAFSSGLQGWAALSGLGDPADTTAQRTLTEWRTLYTDALNNKVTPGMENDPPATN